MKNIMVLVPSILERVRQDTGVDLQGYRQSTLERCIKRRAATDGAPGLDEYARRLQRDRQCYERLVDSLFVGVTDFFRDQEIWGVLQSRIVPGLVRKKMARLRVTPLIRVWCAGCASGEEAYSLAMVFLEALARAPQRAILSVHGTDVTESRLQKAREGKYSFEKLQSVQQAWRDRYFETARDGAFQIKRCLRQATHFKRHDFTGDQDLGKFDLILCRNVLIYFQKAFQQKALMRFHCSLMRGGILWLGSSESLSGEAKGRFEPIDKANRFFRKTPDLRD